MNIHVLRNDKELGKNAACQIASLLNYAIKEKGNARLLLATGASQFTTLSCLVKIPVDWPRVEMFHLDEYIGINDKHKASFRKYLKDRFVSKVKLKDVWYVSGEGNIKNNIALLSKEVSSSPIDVGVVGIGENGHIAFNDPPADFKTKKTYITVNLDKKCRNQQVRELWFNTLSDVPVQAVTMTVNAILKCKNIISCVPYAVKADAVYNILTKKISPFYPAGILKSHPSWDLYLDKNSASKIFP